MKRVTRPLFLLLALTGSLFLTSCGGGPFSPSDQGVVLRGTLVGSALGASIRSGSALAAAPITITVRENLAIQTTVAADGTFVLRGLPEGGFTLEFRQDRTLLGVAAFVDVKPNQEITITVRIDGHTVVVVDEKRNGIGHGDVEIEGKVSEVIQLNPTGESRFRIDGRVVVARPGQTTIREGNLARSVADVTVGRQVHVKGVWLPPEATTQPVLAQEIKLQDGEDEELPPVNACMISGGRVGQGIELEGNVNGGSSTLFMLQVQGNRAGGPVQVDSSAATFQCHPASGPNAPTPQQCRDSVKSGAQVHVSGMLQSCDVAAAMVSASKIIVQ